MLQIAQTIWAGIQANDTLVVGFVGFTGVIIALFFNAREARNQRRDERNHERQAIRVALIEELKINRESLEKNVEGIGEPEDTGTYHAPIDPMDEAYREFLGRIGLLSQVEVQKVMNAYLTMRSYYGKLFLIGAPPDPGGRHVEVPAQNGLVLRGMMENLMPSIDEAIDSIKSALEDS